MEYVSKVIQMVEHFLYKIQFYHFNIFDIEHMFQRKWSEIFLKESKLQVAVRINKWKCIGDAASYESDEVCKYRWTSL